MQLIYHAHRYEYTPSLRPSGQSRAVNWRYQTQDYVSGVGTDYVPHARQPQAVNWRFQASVN
jgi:hypothetical protein